MVSIGPTIGIKGEKAFRASIREIISEAKLLDAQMDKLTATFEKNDSTMTKYEKTSEQLTKQIDQQKVAIDKLKEARDLAADTLKKNTEAYEEQKKKTEEVNKTYTEHVNKLKEAKEQYGENSKEAKKAQEDLNSATNTLNDSTKALTDAETKMHNSAATLSEWDRRIVQAETELHGFNEELKDHSKIKAWGETLEKQGEVLESFGTKLSTFVTAPLTALGAASIKASSDFTDGMAKIYTIAFESSEPMERMRKEIIQLSNDTGFALDDLAEATYQTVSASVDATKAVDFMTQATKLARAGFTTTTKAVDVLTTIMNSYGHETYDVAQINDILLKTQNDGKLIIDELASSLGIIIPLASNYNVGLEQVAAAYATMTKQGVPATKATTFLRAVFTELEKESSTVAEILDQKTGKSFAQLMGEGQNLSDVLRILYDDVGGNAEEFQKLFGNVRATQAVAALVTEDFGILDYELERVTHSTGQTDRALDELETNSLKAKRAVNQLKNSAVILGDTLIEKGSPAFQKIVDGIRNATDSFNGLSDESKNMIINFGLVAAAIPPVILAVGKVAKAISAIIANWEVLMAFHVPLIAGIGAVALGATALAASLAVANNEMIESVRQQYALSEVAETEIQALDALKISHEDFVTQMQQQNVAIVENTNYAQKLVEQYNELVGADGKVSESNKEMADYILGELASALGMEKSQIEQLIDGNGKLTGTIDDVIEHYRQEAEMAVYKEQLTEATRRQIEAERIHENLSKELKEKTDALVEAKKANVRAINAVEEATKSGTEVTQAMRDEVTRTSTELGAAQKAFNDVNAAVIDVSSELNTAKNDVQYYTDKLTALGKEADKTAKKIEEDGKKARDDTAKTGKAVKTNLDVDTYSTGANTMIGYAKGISDNIWRATQAASSAGTAASRSLKNSLQVKSPSKVTYETGEYFVEGFANAIADNMRDMALMGRMLGVNAAEGLGSYVPAYTKSITAPISLNVTVNGNVDDPNEFAKNIADELAVLMSRESEVFA